jgi:hypothetical protein
METGPLSQGKIHSLIMPKGASSEAPKTLRLEVRNERSTDKPIGKISSLVIPLFASSVYEE